MVIDENGNFNFQEWTVPKGWNEITLKQWQDIQRFH